MELNNPTYFRMLMVTWLRRYARSEPSFIAGIIATLNLLGICQLGCRSGSWSAHYFDIRNHYKSDRLETETHTSARVLTLSAFAPNQPSGT